MNEIVKPRSVGIIGWGAFGRFVAELAHTQASDVAVRVYARSKEPDGVQFFSLEEVAQCDVVVLTVPIHAFEETLERVVPHLGAQSIVVDVATVKGHTTEALRKHCAQVPYIATHPMFGPFSYEKTGHSLRGFRLVITEHTLPAETVRALEKWLASLGLVILHLTPDEHDRMLAETLFLTHLIAQGTVEGGFKRTEIDTVSFGFLMDAVESVKHDTELFRDVYRYNRHCRDIPRRLRDALSRVETGLEGRGS